MWQGLIFDLVMEFSPEEFLIPPIVESLSRRTEEQHVIIADHLEIEILKTG